MIINNIAIYGLFDRQVRQKQYQVVTTLDNGVERPAVINGPTGKLVLTKYIPLEILSERLDLKIIEDKNDGFKVYAIKN